MRSYRDLCGIARALDVVGERWALLVVRELLHGPKRFADLHRGLLGMSQNVLSQRLRELEASGVILRARGLPPATGLHYALTEHGRGLESVLLALGRWGSPLPPGPDSADELSPDALVVALETTFDPTVAGDLRGTVRLDLAEDAFVLTFGAETLEVSRSDDPGTDATLTASVRCVQDLVFDKAPLTTAIDHGAARVDGDVRFLERALVSFDDGRSATS